ncbi:NADP-dependent dehydrogenase-like protein [Immersiella caudata]|uniref:NADP-dependent dehydrogenase-like protein n=1 Tax=Immersiella caudata TaxID=314043 RepID=A0AA40C3G3_9PEZI|nr:NADP-dependent dehydrogenase-like protein [Immersiella caudata]
MPTFVISGARTGLGLENVRHLSQTPSNTIFALVRSLTGDISALQAAQSASTAKVHILECDTSSSPSISALPAQIKAIAPDTVIDVLINMAAILHSGEQNSLSLTSGVLLSHITTNVLGPALLTSALLPMLSPTAKIVNITSGLASLELLSNGTISTDSTAYSISKAALNMLTVHQAKQLPEGMVVVCVDPGHCKTEMGGPNATVEPEDSAKGLQAIIEGLKGSGKGRFYWYTGKELPW